MTKRLGILKRFSDLKKFLGFLKKIFRFEQTFRDLEKILGFEKVLGILKKDCPDCPIRETFSDLKEIYRIGKNSGQGFEKSIWI